MARFRLPIFLAGVALLAGMAVWAGLQAVERAFATLGWGGFAIVFLIHLPLIGLMGVAWWSITWHDDRIGPLAFVKARLVRDAVAELLPFSQVGGFAAAIRLLSLTGIPARQAATSLFADLLMEFLAKLLYAAAGLALLDWLRPGNALLLYLLATVVLLAAACVVVFFLRDLLVRSVAALLRRWAKLEDAGSGLRSFLGLTRLAPSGILHAIGWAFGGFEAWVTLRLMGIPVTLVQALAIDSLVTSLRTFGFWVPGSLGVQEAAYVLVGAQFGLGSDVAMAFSLVRRARDILIGVAGIGIWHGHEIRAAAGALPACKRADAESSRVEAI